MIKTLDALNLQEIYHGYMYSYPHKTAYGELSDVSFKQYTHVLEEAANQLYIHIPFCETKCGYCNLFSVTNKDSELQAQYVSAIEEHMIQSRLGDKKWESLIIGGGTPLLLSEKLLEELFTMSERRLGINHTLTFSSIETSPNQTTKGKLDILKSFSIDRISIGVQSFHEDELKSLKRAHDLNAIKDALELIKKANFKTVNIDLIYGIKGQTIESIQNSLKHALCYEPEEIFAYPLYIRQKTGLEREKLNPDTYKMYIYIRDTLLTSGYFQTSMRRFTKAAREAESSCGFENTVAYGCGGRSYLGNLHFCTPYHNNQSVCMKQIQEYVQTSDKTGITNGILLKEDEVKRRYVIKNLLHVTGIHISEYKKIFNSECLQDFAIFEELFQKGYAILWGDKISLTPVGVSVSDYIGPLFISRDMKEKMSDWGRLNV